MQQLRYVHRWVALVVGAVALFLGVTGTLIQAVDLRSIYAQAPATDADVRAMRESFDGPGDFAVRTTADYLAQPLPAGVPDRAMLDRVLRGARAALGDAPLRYVEFRMVDGRPVGQAGVGEGHARFDASGALVERTARDPREDPSPASTRNTFKRLHRLTTFGDWAVIVNILAAIGLATLIVTGILIYLKLLFQRRRMGRRQAFWRGGDQWRHLHRTISVACSLLLAWVTITGAWLAVDGLYRNVAVRSAVAPGTPAPPPAPVRDAQAPAMLRVTLAAVREAAPGEPVKVVRLRNYGGYRQGVIVTGGDRSRQLVFDADTGAAMSETEPGYPRVHFPFGWQAHQWAKSLHRGDMFGMTGRWLDLVAGLAMVYLSVSGGVMYWKMWQRRQQGGRRQIVWR